MSHAVYGLVGYPLSHSFSPAYFNDKFHRLGIDAKYLLYPIADIGGLRSVISNPHLKGLNVTIPYKEVIISYLDKLTTAAAEIGAVNCIAIHEGKTIGYNTDATGFEKSLTPLLKEYHTHALILGTGGASKAVMYTLDKLGIKYQTVSRYAAPGILGYADLNPEIMQQYKLIINTTPLGMYPNIDEYPPLPYDAAGAGHLFYDLVYNPATTAFLAKGAAHGAAIKNGLEMLELQAEASWEIWNSYK